VLVEDRCKKSDTPLSFGFWKTRKVTKIFLRVLSGPDTKPGNFLGPSPAPAPTNPSCLHCARTTINDGELKEWPGTNNHHPIWRSMKD
jgi:hypothetical protein